ncbi:alpha/beta hydrolase-fold protein [Algoriphagus sp. D3-2-R+10]|uniref:alpha/beta hydrolase-fold protein n=1 Tax=Algoriphagus aurantiacus TaxID=3103948 RepID=UPI002B3B3340|nr:alpha/beta hydrolase-fold protein [Algoriphagus sp. D3-2-R+10]MEB2775483.1 alpha/beta hydrolase-fold protein [Algoriphagus sp. D3-2-R+10]
MKKNLLLSLLSLFMIGMNVQAQEALFGAQQITSPEIHDDSSVTFRIFAPTATSVHVTGDFLPTVKMETPMGEMDGPGKVELVKDDKGVWSFTSDALSPELYSYSFIVDDLKTTDPSNPFLIRDVASVTNVFIVGEGQAALYRVKDVPHGTVARRWHDSPGLDMDRRLTIYTPPGYEQSDEKFPVLYLLHGAGGDEEAWIALGRTAQIMDNLIAQGKAKPMLVVMPNGNVIQDAAPGEGNKGMYKPAFMIPKTMDGTYEANFMDVVNFVESNYQVKADKANRAIAGLSMGGYHTMHISRFYPNMFDYIGLFSAAIMPREDATNNVYNDIDGTLKTQMENGYKLYWIAIGKTDFLYDANTEYRAKLDSMEMPYEYVESEGGHIWRNWRVYLTQFVPQLFQ